MKLKTTFLLLFLLSMSSNITYAQSSWEQCSDGRTVVHCETYNCPAGDTNGDGSCSLEDDNSRLTDVRNDSFCSNPPSGCGEVRYFPANTNNSCLVRIEDTTTTCNLSANSSPTFTPRATSTPRPTPTPTSTPTPTPLPTPPESPTASASGEKLPETGSEMWIGLAVVLAGVLGVYLYEKYKFV